MNILFLQRHFGSLRNYERAIRALAGHHHQIRLVALQGDDVGGRELADRLVAEERGISWEMAPWGPEQVRDAVPTRLRLAYDYLRYLDPAFAATPRLVERAAERTPRTVVAGSRMAPVRAVMRPVLESLDRAIPHPEVVERFFLQDTPDVVMLTPLIGLGSPEMEYFLAARRLGLRTVFCVWSWDNLSSKAFLRAVPDATIVWNETQKQEAVHLHGLPAERVVVTGAQAFDHWFDRRPSRSREAFCARVGLPADRPFLLWVCSALFRGSRPEAEFVRRWVEAIRSSADPILRDVPILVRPHPSRRKEWNSVSLSDYPPVSLWGANPIDAESRDDYFDSLYYSAAVAGLNTSAFLEAAIVGRPVYTVLLPEHYENQEGTLHFPYLLNVGDGLLHAQRTLEAHLTDLAHVLRGPVEASERSSRFVGTFIRPCGLDVAATDRLVTALEQIGARPAQPPLRAASALSKELYAVALRLLETSPGRALLRSPEERVAERGRVDRIHGRRREKRRAQRAAQLQRIRKLFTSAAYRREAFHRLWGDAANKSR